MRPASVRESHLGELDEAEGVSVGIEESDDALAFVQIEGFVERRDASRHEGGVDRVDVWDAEYRDESAVLREGFPDGDVNSADDPFEVVDEISVLREGQRESEGFVVEAREFFRCG
jgi:hypothetical protein